MRRTAERRLSLEPVLARRGDPLLRRLPAADRRAAMPSTPSRCRRAGGATRRATRRGAPGRRACCRRPTSSGCSPPSARASAPTIMTRRMEVLLGNGDTAERGARRSPGRRPARRPLFEARLALQTRARRRRPRWSPRSIPSAARDPGLIIDRAIWLRNTGQSAAARQLLANRPPARPAAGQSGALARHRADPGARRRQRPQLATAYGIASQARRPLPARHRRLRPALWRARRLYEPGLARRPGGAVPARPARRRGAAVRALRPRRALAADPGQGLLLGRARRRRRRAAPAEAQRLARAGGRQPRPVLRPARARAARPHAAAAADAAAGRARPSAPPSPRRPLAEAIRYLGMVGRRGDQTLFVRALAGHARATTASAPSPASSAARSAGSTSASGRRARRATTGETFYARPPSPKCRSRPLMRATGRSPTASSARKARSSAPR